MTHDECERLLAVYGDLAAAARERVDRHLASCQACARAAAAYRAMDADLRALSDPRPSPRLAPALRALAVGAMERERPTAPSRWVQVAEYGMLAVLLAVAWLVIRGGSGGALRGILPAAGGPTATPSPLPTPTLSTPGPGVAALLAAAPAPGESVEVDAYYSALGASSVLRGGPAPVPGTVACPSWADILADQPVLPVLSVLNGRRSNPLPHDGAWLLAALPEQTEPGTQAAPDLPHHARLRGRLGDPAFAHCPNAARILVVEEVVHVYTEEHPQPAPFALPADYATWPRHEDARHGYTLPYPPGWAARQDDDGTLRLSHPAFPAHAIVVRVHEGETHHDQYDPASRPPLLDAESMGVYSQGLAFGEGAVPDSQGLAGYVVSERRGDDEQTGRLSTAVLFSAHGRTHELALYYPTGFSARQEPLTAYSAMVEGFRLHVPPKPTAAPPLRVELGEGPFLSEEEALAAVRERDGQDVEQVAGALLSEADARRMAEACATFFGHPDGVWVLTVRGEYEGARRTLRLFLDAETGEQLCGEEVAPFATPAATGPDVVLREPSPAVTATPAPAPPAAAPRQPLQQPMVAWVGPMETHADAQIGSALDYPAGWHLQAEEAGAAVLTSFVPEEGRGGVPAGQVKIDLLPDKPSEGRTLEALVAEARSPGDLYREDWVLAGGVPAVRVQRRAEAAGGEVALLLAVIDGRGLRLTGYGDLAAFDAVAGTLRPIGVDLPPPSPPALSTRDVIAAADDGETFTYPVGAEFTVIIDDGLYLQGGPDWAALDVLEPLGVSTEVEPPLRGARLQAARPGVCTLRTADWLVLIRVVEP
jgi:hypothetical protein